MEDIGEVGDEEGDLHPFADICRFFFHGRLRNFNLSAELSVQPVRRVLFRHRPVGDVVSLVEELFRGIVGPSDVAVGNIHDQVNTSASGLNGRKAHRQFQRAVRIIYLIVFNFVEINAGDDLSRRYAIFEHATSSLGQGSHRTHGQVLGLGIDDVDLWMLGDEVQDNLLGRIRSRAGILNAEINGIRVN